MERRKKVLLSAGVVTSAALLSGLFLLKKRGWFQSAKVVKGSVIPMKLLYTVYRGNYDNDDAIFQVLEKKAAQLNIPKDNQQFVGIYFDDCEEENINQNECRAILGLIVDLVDERFLESYRTGQDKQFKIAQLQAARQGIQCQLYARNKSVKQKLSSKAYSALKQYIIQNKESEKVQLAIEIFDTRKINKNYFVILPYEGYQQYLALLD